MRFEKGGNGRQFASQSQTYLGDLDDGGLGIVGSSKFQKRYARTICRRSRVGIRVSKIMGLHIHEPGSECLPTLGNRHLACLNLVPALRRGITPTEL